MILTANVLEFYSKFWLTLVFKKWKVAVSLHAGLICLNALIFYFIEWMFLVDMEMHWSSCLWKSCGK